MSVEEQVDDIRYFVDKVKNGIATNDQKAVDSGLRRLYLLTDALMTYRTAKTFKDAGWIIECESPLEIYHEESNSRATGIAARFIINNFDPEDWE